MATLDLGEQNLTTPPPYPHVSSIYIYIYIRWHPEWTPPTEAWGKYMDKRMEQITRIEDTQQKWDGWLVAMQQVIAWS